MKQNNLIEELMEDIRKHVRRAYLQGCCDANDQPNTMPIHLWGKSAARVSIEDFLSNDSKDGSTNG
jgi:hypothetical protein